MADRTLLSISEVAQATGLQGSALRYYEKAGLISSVARVAGRRHYESSVLQRLAAIALFQEVGFTIAEVVELLGDGSGRDRWRSMATQRLNEIDAHLERVEAARALLASALSCDCTGLDTCELVSTRRGHHARALRDLVRGRVS